MSGRSVEATRTKVAEEEIALAEEDLRVKRLRLAMEAQQLEQEVVMLSEEASREEVAKPGLLGGIGSAISAPFKVLTGAGKAAPSTSTTSSTAIVAAQPVGGGVEVKRQPPQRTAGDPYGAAAMVQPPGAYGAPNGSPGIGGLGAVGANLGGLNPLGGGAAPAEGNEAWIGSVLVSMRAETKTLRAEVVRLTNLVVEQDALLNGMVKVIPADYSAVPQPSGYVAKPPEQQENHIGMTYPHLQSNGYAAAAGGGTVTDNSFGVATGVIKGIDAVEMGVQESEKKASGLLSVIFGGVNEEFEPAEEVSLEESMWGVVLLIGTPPMGTLCSAVLIFLFIQNIAMQSLFIYLLGTTSLTQAEYDEDLVAQYRSWRRNEAHSVQNYDVLGDQSLAVRVCNGDVLSVSATVADAYGDVEAYLEDSNWKGTMMAGLALIAWYCTVMKEVNGTINSYFVTRSIPVLPTNETTIVKNNNGGYRITSLSRERLVVRVFVSAIRFGIAFMMFLQGTQFLVYTISIGDLLLNAVALEFVISTDELLYSSLAPARSKRVLRMTSGFKLAPAATFKGMDLRSLTMILVIFGFMMPWQALTYMKPQLDVLKDVKAAICYGEKEFVYAIDGVGTVAWSPGTCSGQVCDGTNADSAGNWINDPTEDLKFKEFIINAALSGYGFGSCPVDQCYDPAGAIPIPLSSGRAPCCLPFQTKVDSIVGGKFSLATKGAESLSDATEIWNPACSDTLDFVAYYINLLQGSLGEEIIKEIEGRLNATALADYLEPCGGQCSAEKPLCKPQARPVNQNVVHPDCNVTLDSSGNVAGGDGTTDSGGDCTQTVNYVGPNGYLYDTAYSCSAPDCSDAIQYCSDSQPVGVRARQICPRTCGCHLPRDSLSLFLPESGCPPKCQATSQYRDALRSTPCEDVTRNDTARWAEYQLFLDDYYEAADVWPKDWKESGQVYIDLFRRFGCDYLRMDSPAEYVTYEPNYWPASGLVNDSTGALTMPAAQPLFWTANFNAGVNPCVENGYYYPVRPMSFFCPVACGCRAGDKHCPDSCPARFDSPNADGQVDYSNLEPNPSPRNVPDFPWRYAPLPSSR